MQTAPVDIHEEEVRPAEVAKHVASAHRLLTELGRRVRRIENYPELQEAIRKLEVALSLLAVGTSRIP